MRVDKCRHGVSAVIYSHCCARLSSFSARTTERSEGVRGGAPTGAHHHFGKSVRCVVLSWCCRTKGVHSGITNIHHQAHRASHGRPYQPNRSQRGVRYQARRREVPRPRALLPCSEHRRGHGGILHRRQARLATL